MKMADQMDDVDSLLEAPFQKQAPVAHQSDSPRDDVVDSSRSREPTPMNDNQDQHGSPRQPMEDGTENGVNNVEDRTSLRHAETDQRRGSSRDQKSPSRERRKGDDKERKRSRSRERKRSRSRDRKRSRSKERKRSRSRDRKRSKDRDIKPIRIRERRRSRSKERKRSRSKDRKRSRSRERKRSRSRDRKLITSREKKRSRSRERKRSRSRERKDKKRSRSRERKRSKSREKKRSRSKERKRGDEEKKRSHSKDRGIIKPFVFWRDRFRRRSRSVSPDRRKRSWSKSPIRVTKPEMTTEERDARTVFCMQLSMRIRNKDLEEFFSAVGKVTDVRIIMDNRTGKSKGVAYIEFKDVESVPLAVGLTGQKLLGVPIIVQQSFGEKNRAAMGAKAGEMMNSEDGPTRLYIGSLHYNIREDMLRAIFEPFGSMSDVKVMTSAESNESLGYGFITFTRSRDAHAAMEQMNGYELVGRPLKIGYATDRNADSQNTLDDGFHGINSISRLQLMAKLAEGTGMTVPNASSSSNAPEVPQQTPTIATPTFMLSNMFDPSSESGPNWDAEISDSVIEECNKHGGVLHIYVDKASPQGNVYVKCPSIAAAAASVNGLHGRYFGGRVITAAYVPLLSYNTLFEDATIVKTFVLTSAQKAAGLGAISADMASNGMLDAL